MSYDCDTNTRNVMERVYKQKIFFKHLLCSISYHWPQGLAQCVVTLGGDMGYPTNLQQNLRSQGGWVEKKETYLY